ncbi:MAG: hypothetical protein KDD64_02950 [Bdellovibrionales bacterium]|nr:hypothetical protein [Bdellovibrionales bacterium]
MGQKPPVVPFRWAINQDLLERGIRLLCRPVARLCLTLSVPIQELHRIFKELYLECAIEELSESLGKEPSVRQLSLATGLHRKELAKLTGKVTEEIEQRSYWITRLFGQWEGDPQFQTGRGEPRALTYRGEGNEFAELVKSVNADMEPGSALNELNRMRLVKVGDQKVSLQRLHFSVSADSDAFFHLLSDQIETVIESLAESSYGDIEPQHHHLRTEYDNIFLDEIPAVRAWIEREGKKLHKRLRLFLAERDADVCYEPSRGAGGKVVFTSLSLASPIEDEEESAT